MPRGTTPTNTYTLPFPTELVEKVRIIFSQRDGLKIKKTEKDVEMEGNTVKIRLTQEETFLLKPTMPVKHQIRVRTTGGDVFKSKVYTFTVDECLDSEVL
jgi:hypothetical protein